MDEENKNIQAEDYIIVKINFIDTENDKDGYSIIILNKTKKQLDTVISTLVDIDSFNRYRQETIDDVPVELPNTIDIWRTFFDAILDCNNEFGRNNKVDQIDYDLTSFFNNQNNLENFLNIIDQSFEKIKQLFLGIYQSILNTPLKIFIELEYDVKNQDNDEILAEKLQEQETIQNYKEIYDNKTILSAVIEIEPAKGIPVHDISNDDKVFCIIPGTPENIEILKDITDLNIELNSPIALSLYKLLNLNNNYYKVFLKINDNIIAQDILEQKSRVKTEQDALISNIKELLPQFESQQQKIKQQYKKYWEIGKIISLVLFVLLFIYLMIKYGLTFN